ncbi:MAG: hypothetical protein WCK78_12215 [Paludibacter sp.]
MKNVSEIVELITQRTKHIGAITPEFSMKINDDLKSLLLTEIKADFGWLWHEKIITPELLVDCFTQDELSEAGIFVKGTHDTGLAKIITCGNAIVKSFIPESSVCYNDSKVISLGGVHRAYDNSTVELLEEGVIYAFNHATAITKKGESVIFQHDQSSVVAHKKTVVVRNNGVK